MDNTYSHLLNLPAEMLEAIVGTLPASNLLTFRLACKAINEIAWPYIQETFFARGRHLISNRTSVQRLLRISECERLAKGIQCIKLVALTILDDVDEFEERRDELYATQEEKDKDDVMELYDETKTDEVMFYRYGLYETLEAIFTNLRRIEHHVSITFEDLAAMERRSEMWGYNSVLSKFPEVIFERARNYRYHHAVYEAVLKSGYAPTGLAIGAVDYRMPTECLAMRPNQVFSYSQLLEDFGLEESYFDFNLVPLESEGPDQPNRHTKYLCSERLRVLYIHLCSVGDYDSENGSDDDGVAMYPTRRSEVRSFVNIIAKASELKELWLSHALKWVLDTTDMSFQRALSEDLFQSLVERAYSDGAPIDLPCEGPLVPKLKVLSVSNLMIPLQRLLHFCRQRRATLRRVLLRNILDDRVRDSNEVKQQIREAAGASPSDDFEVNLEDCYEREWSREFGQL